MLIKMQILRPQHRPTKSDLGVTIHLNQQHCDSSTAERRKAPGWTRASHTRLHASEDRKQLLFTLIVPASSSGA